MALTTAATHDGPWPLLIGWSEYCPAGVIQLACDRAQLAMSFKMSGGAVSTNPFDSPFVQSGPVHKPSKGMQMFETPRVASGGAVSTNPFDSPFVQSGPVHKPSKGMQMFESEFGATQRLLCPSA